MLATYMRRMRSNNLEIRIVGSSCPSQLVKFVNYMATPTVQLKEET